MNRSGELVLVGAGGALLAGAVGAPFGLAAPFAVVGAANGAIGGWRQVYAWGSARGWLAFGLDSTWACITTAGAVLGHLVVAIKRDHSYSAALSRRQNRHVYGKGLQFRKGFATTVGNEISGAGDVSHSRRARLVTDHEDVHVWQARWFGPLFPLLYFGWMALGGLIGAIAWILGVRKGPFAKTVESFAYYLNPFEWWAYSRDANWPPSGLVAGIGPKRPCVRSFVETRGLCDDDTSTL